MSKYIFYHVAVFLFVSFAGPAAAGPMEGPCYQCHTMHNSQDNQPMRFSGESQPVEKLLRATCVECHTGITSAAAGSSFQRNSGSFLQVSEKARLTWPKVMSAGGAPVYVWGDSTGISNGTLAGGNFYWVTINESNGHNVSNIPAIEMDTRLGNTPPGGTELKSRLQCSGTNGCHGNTSIDDPLDAMEQAHHFNVKGVTDGKTVGSSYRFLRGVKGIEDDDWEWTVNSLDHNRYTGIDRESANQSADISTMSGFCATCHGSYHNTVDGTGTSGISNDNNNLSSPWLRHPADYDMSQTGDYAGYTSYDTRAPMARSWPAISTGNNAEVKGGQRILMCLTCHRAHGSPYNASLRWNYRAWPGKDPVTGVSQDGCQICHTSKR